MSALVDRALQDAGLAVVLDARRNGEVDEALVERLRTADLLALGALADLIRAAEVGHEVRIYLEPPDGEDGTSPAPPERGRNLDAILLPDGQDLTGLELLREVAIARIRGPKGARIRVDWSRCGLELAQVAMGFGANELVGRVSNKRGLPFAEGELLGVGKKSRLLDAEVVKRNELAGFIRRAGREPIFDGRSPASPEPGQDLGRGDS
jgi:hypothetical protein